MKAWDGLAKDFDTHCTPESSTIDTIPTFLTSGFLLSNQS